MAASRFVRDSLHCHCSIYLDVLSDCLRMSYEEQLKDVRWLSKRDEILERDDYCCQDCLCGKETMKYIKLHVHHRKYISGRMAWDYPNEYLITLCDECHSKLHGLIPDLRPNRLKPTFVYGELVHESRPARHISEVIADMIKSYYAEEIH